jgi:Cu(I)/Ag(I) efflux system membrane protein CusA/SilA
MTAFTTFAALLPVMTATGRGADVARAMALPVFFGMLIELVSLFVVPVLYCGYMEFKLRMRWDDPRWAAKANLAGAQAGTA